MTTALDKAGQSPDSMKAKILLAARMIFGEYGYHGTTTRMIAKTVGIACSTELAENRKNVSAEAKMKVNA